MACLLVAPRGRAKGVVSITTPERDNLILKDSALRHLLTEVKERFVVGLHHNWHDHAFVYNPLFDFSFAGDGDLIEVNKRAVPRIGMDACNFAPSYFRPVDGAKFWDILHVSRAVPFKNVPLFFRTVRRLYDRGHRLRVLYICPVPPSESSANPVRDARREYEATFSDEEQKLFNFLTMDYRYPFPFDLETLAFFYGSSKIFVHCSDMERRCRVAGYAWAAGLPVVAQACVGSLLPSDLRREPYFFEASDEASFAGKIIAALAASSEVATDWQPARAIVSADSSKATLLRRLRDLCAKLDVPFNPSVTAFDNLDIRLGRHHFSAGNNGVPQPLVDFLRFLRDADDAAIAAKMRASDPEILLCGMSDRADVTAAAGGLPRGSSLTAGAEEQSRAPAGRRRLPLPRFLFDRSVVKR